MSCQAKIKKCFSKKLPGDATDVAGRFGEVVVVVVEEGEPVEEIAAA